MHKQKATFDATHPQAAAIQARFRGVSASAFQLASARAAASLTAFVNASSTSDCRFQQCQ